MADENTPDVKPAKGVKNAAPADAAQPAPEPKGDPSTGLDGALGRVRGETSVHDSVRVMVDRLAQLFTDAAIESPDAAEKLAIELRQREEEFANAVKENAAELAARPSNTPDAPFQASQAQPLTEEELLARNHSAPHNDAAAAAVEAGMDTRTANEMTQVGSNI